MDEADKELENYRALLRRQEQNWQARFESVLHSDRAAVDIGLLAVRTAILMNAGAIVALLAFVGQLWDVDRKGMAGMLSGASPFVWGLVSAASAAAVAYIYQSFVTAIKERGLAEVSEGAGDLMPFVWVPRLTAWTKIPMVGFVALSYGLFIWGTFGLLDVLPK